MDLLRNLQSEVRWQLIDEHVEPGHIQTVVILQRFLDLEVELVCDSVLGSEIVEKEKLFLQSCL